MPLLRARRRPRTRAASVPSPERPELVADEVRRRDEHDRDRLRHDLAEAELDEQRQDREVADVGDQRDDEEAERLEGYVATAVREGRETVQGVVVCRRDE